MKFLFVVLLSVCTTIVFASNKLPTKKTISDKPLPCTVTVSKPGLASGVDCNGVLYAQALFGTCTATSTNCEQAFIDASGCSTTDLNSKVAAVHRREQAKCGIGTPIDWND